uniref:Uncharacterized protein n=1 Tax=Campylobacter phage vB_CJ12660_3PH123 TaxID=3236702 RepID=A0AB39C483_9VIRU
MKIEYISISSHILSFFSIKIIHFFQANNVP